MDQKSCVVYWKGGLSTVIIRLNLENSSWMPFVSARVLQWETLNAGGANVYKKHAEHESDQSISVSTEITCNNFEPNRKKNSSQVLIFVFRWLSVWKNSVKEKNSNCKRKCKQSKKIIMKEYLAYSCLVSENYLKKIHILSNAFITKSIANLNLR